MYIIRPKGIHKTPHVLANMLGTQTRRWPNRQRHFRPDWKKDFFLWYPDGVQNADDTYKMLRSFFFCHKAGQRRLIADMGLPVPETMPPRPGQKYVIRPLNHMGGKGYRVSASPDCNAAFEYSAPLFPKTHEYRLVFVHGQATCFLRKRPRDGVGPEEPWNADVAPFRTIKDWPNSKLQVNTDAFQKLNEANVVKAAHLLAIDILYNHLNKIWCVCEFNTCPGLDIEANRQKIVEAIVGKV